jgi:hypothetical protein
VEEIEGMARIEKSGKIEESQTKSGNLEERNAEGQVRTRKNRGEN